MGAGAGVSAGPSAVGRAPVSGTAPLAELADIVASGPASVARATPFVTVHARVAAVVSIKFKGVSCFHAVLSLTSTTDSGAGGGPASMDVALNARCAEALVGMSHAAFASLYVSDKAAARARVAAFEPAAMRLSGAWLVHLCSTEGPAAATQGVCITELPR